MLIVGKQSLRKVLSESVAFSDFSQYNRSRKGYTGRIFRERYDISFSVRSSLFEKLKRKELENICLVLRKEICFGLL